MIRANTDKKYLLQTSYLMGKINRSIIRLSKEKDSRCIERVVLKEKIIDVIKSAFSDDSDFYENGHHLFNYKEIEKARMSHRGLNMEGKVMVQVFKDGKRIAIKTDAETEEEFIRKMADVFTGMIEKKMFEGDWQFNFERILPQIVDICCKMRGYKTDVEVRRVILSGLLTEHSSDIFFESM